MDTVIVGAGHNGLAMSRALTRRNVQHLVLDRGGVADAWRTQRRSGLRLLTPNWANGLPGAPYRGPACGGYMHVSELGDRLDRYAALIAAPIQRDTHVMRVRRVADGYHIKTTQGPILCRSLVLATGACARPRVPAMSVEVPRRVVQTTPTNYRHPDDLPTGGVLVVGASSSGVQIARELQLSGRPVTLAVGRLNRLPRHYRGRDIEWWLETTGMLDDGINKVEDLEHARRTPSPQLVGGPDAADINALQDIGVRIAGRLADIRSGEALFSEGLADALTSADLMMDRFLKAVDDWIAVEGLGSVVPPADRPEPTRLSSDPVLRARLDDGSIKAIVWATGFAPDFSFLDMPVFGTGGRICHCGGVVDAQGLYVMGLPFLRTRRSHQISGAAGDAQALASYLFETLSGRLQLAA